MALQPLNLQSIQQRSGGTVRTEPAALTQQNPQYNGGNPFNNISQEDLQRILFTLIMSMFGRGGGTNRPPINPPINPPPCIADGCNGPNPPIADGWNGPNPPIADGPRPPVCPPPPIADGWNGPNPPIADGPRPPNPPIADGHIRPPNPPIADGHIRPPNPPIADGVRPNPPIADGVRPNPPIADGVRPNPPIADGVRPNPPIADGVRPNPPIADGVRPNPPIADGVRPNPPIADGVRPNPPIADGHIRPPNPPIGRPDSYDVTYGDNTFNVTYVGDSLALRGENASVIYNFHDLQILFEQFKASDQYPLAQTNDLHTTPWGFTGSSSVVHAFYNYLLEDVAGKG